MKKIGFIFLCVALSLSANNKKRVRVTQGSCKGHEGYIVQRMTINLNIETEEMLDVLLDRVSPEVCVTEQQVADLVEAIELFKKTKSFRPALCFVHNESQFLGVFDAKSLEEIK
ncbi:MAG: hypothetical protein P4L31_04495 [Candidatus Babeliales bacterium]|nr:hypothetical protein [Candidatus Babeliales bacterium]